MRAVGAFHLDTALISRLDAGEFACAQGRMNAIRDVRRDPNVAHYLE